MSSSSSSAASASAEPPSGTAYPGQRLGLPATGRGATAGWPRRILALALDWLACLLVTRLVGASGAAEGWVTLLVFFVEVSLFTALVGGSFGQLLTRIAVVRSFLICLVVPPLIYNRDQRGLHDLAIGTITVRR